MRSGFYLTRDLYATLEPRVAAALLSPRESALLLVIDTIDTWQQGRFGERLAPHHAPEIYTRLMAGSAYAWFVSDGNRTLQVRVDLKQELFPIEVTYRVEGYVDRGVDEVLSHEGSAVLRQTLGEEMLADARG